MRPVTTMFSCILILLGMMLFQSTDAAKDIFTVNNMSPASNDAFGAVFISQQEHDTMIQQNQNGNSIYKTFNLQTPISYFNNNGRGENELNKIHVSWNTNVIRITFTYIRIAVLYLVDFIVVSCF